MFFERTTVVPFRFTTYSVFSAGMIMLSGSNRILSVFSVLAGVAHSPISESANQSVVEGSCVGALIPDQHHEKAGLRRPINFEHVVYSLGVESKNRTATQRKRG